MVEEHAETRADIFHKRKVTRRPARPRHHVTIPVNAMTDPNSMFYHHRMTQRRHARPNKHPTITRLRNETIAAAFMLAAIMLGAFIWSVL
jgi:hypothetical protein